MKITPADHWFSMCVRERASWKCERCGKQYHPGNKGIDCCHYQGRAAHATRFEPLNCFCLCRGCHQFLDSRKGTFEKFFKEKRGQEIYDIVVEKSDNIVVAKMVNECLKAGELTKYYKATFEEMQNQRKNGNKDWLDFTGLI